MKKKWMAIALVMVLLTVQVINASEDISDTGSNQASGEVFDTGNNQASGEVSDTGNNQASGEVSDQTDSHGDGDYNKETDKKDEITDPEVLDRIRLKEMKVQGNRQVPQGYEDMISYAKNSQHMPVDVMVNGYYLRSEREALVINYRTYIPLRAILEAYCITDIRWMSDSYKVKVVSGDTEILFPINKNEIIVNDVSVEMDSPTLLIDGITMVPVRFVSEILGCDLEWDSTYYTVLINNDHLPLMESRIDKRNYSYEELQIFAKLVTKEAGSVSYETMHGVASVVMNQVAHPGLADNIYDVIYDVKGSVHFPPAHQAGFTSTIPYYDCVLAVKNVLRGENSVATCIYFNTSPFKGKTVYKQVDGVYFCY